MKPVQLTFVKAKIPGVAHIQLVVFEAGNEVILFCIDLDGQIKQESIALGLNSRIVLRDIEVFQSKDVRTLGQAAL